MKKFLAIVLAAIMICVSFVACSSKTDDKSNNDSQQATLTLATNAEFPPTQSPARTLRVKRKIVKAGKTRITESS